MIPLSARLLHSHRNAERCSETANKYVYRISVNMSNQLQQQI